jgi:energy-coupling factor transporter ATP-binding protein EcfA2
MRRLGLLVALLALAASQAQGQAPSVVGPRIVGISPATVEPGTTAAIAVEDFPQGASFSVSFDGIPAEIVSTSQNLITVIVPKSLTELNPNPLVYVLAMSKDLDDVSATAQDVVKVLVPTTSRAEPTGFIAMLGRSWVGIALIIGALVFGAGFATLLARKAAAREKAAARATPAGPVAAASPPAAPLQLPPVAVPEQLAMAVATRDAVAYIGGGLSAQAGLVPWSALLFAAVDDLAERGSLDPTKALSIRDLIARERIADAADTLWREARSEVAPSLQRLLEGDPHSVAECHREIVRLPFVAYLTTNFDSLLEQAFAEADSPLPVLTHLDSQRCLDALSRGERMLLKLSGELDRADSVLLGAHQLQEAIRASDSLREAASRVYLNRTLFFIGASLQGIEDFLQTVGQTRAHSRRHFALVAVQDATWEVRADALRERYGVEVIPFSLADQSTAIVKFLRDLRTREKRIGAQNRADPSSKASRKSAWLKRLTLKNIGAFRHLELDLDREWNLLLGDNGVGKSTVLKAIAIGLIGEEAAPFAERIIRRGSTEAEIVLQTDAAAYTTSIRRRASGGVAIESIPTRASDEEGWLAVGFPALRTVTWERPPGEVGLGARRPTSADLLPLLWDKADPRLDALKQRIVTLDHLSKTEHVEDSTDRHHTRLLQELWLTFAGLIEGQSIAFKSIDPQTREISVQTADGVVPLEALSQGTISMLSWVGVLLQRLYEVTPTGEDPKKRYAIVLIDEIDSHLHPAWQLSVVQSLSKAFEKVQFIATTHSPLVVRGMKVEQVFRFKRNADGVVEQVDVPPDMTMGRPDQVLAGALFEVDADLDAMTEETIAEYQRLLVKEKRTEKEERRYEELQAVLRFRIPVPATSAPDRRARELMNALIEEHVAESAPQTKVAVRNRLNALITELTREDSNRGSRK